MFYQEIDYKDPKACFDFLTNHFTYYTMNSWNGMESIANNVKLYRLPDIDDNDALAALEEDDYASINIMIKDWEDDHPGYSVGFNGRSGGYLVLYSNDHNGHVFKKIADSPCNYDNYEDWKTDVEYDWESLDNYMDVLIKQVKIVQAFDKLCDDLYEGLKELIKEYKKRLANTHIYHATLRFQRYDYDTLEDFKLHMADMKQRGYAVYECDEADLWAEYEMNQSITSEVVTE